MEQLDKKNPEPVPVRQPYSQPNLKVYGDIRDLTLAPTPLGQIESGRGLNRRRISFPPAANGG